MYELDDADIPAAVAAMNESAAAGKIDMSPAMDLAQRPPRRSGTALTRPDLVVGLGQLRRSPFVTSLNIIN